MRKSNKVELSKDKQEGGAVWKEPVKFGEGLQALFLKASFILADIFANAAVLSGATQFLTFL